jgi:ecdysteroid 2-hydroxylase
MYWDCRAYSGVASEEDIPFLRGVPLLGRSLSIAKAGGAPKFHRYVEARHGELGPIYRECLGQLTATFVSEPTLMRAVFTAEGLHPTHFLPEPWILYNQRFNCKRGLLFM